VLHNGHSKHEMCAHGFRSSASTILNERGHKRDVIQDALAHQDEDQTRRAYNRALYWPERVKLMQDWGRSSRRVKAIFRGAQRRLIMTARSTTAFGPRYPSQFAQFDTESLPLVLDRHRA
jgi:hypothetical protein